MEKLLTAVEVGEVTLLCVRSSKTLARLNASDLDCLLVKIDGGFQL